MTRASSKLVFAGLVFVAVVASNMFGQSKESDTPIEEPAFRLTLPGHWSTKPSSDPTRWIYQRNRGEQLTISLVSLKRGMGKDEQSKVFRRLVEMRKHAESATPGLTAVTTTDVSFGESGGILAARYGGTEPAAHRHFMCLMLGSTSEFTVFYYEAVGLTQSETEARAKAILDSVSVRDRVLAP